MHSPRLGSPRLGSPRLGSPKSRNAELAGTAGVLTVTIIRARDLVPMDKAGKSDPYCEVSSNSSTQSFQTKVIHSLAPTWDESYCFLLGSLRPVGTITISLRDKDLLTKDDSMGYVIVPLTKLINHDDDTFQDWFQLESEPEPKKGLKKLTPGALEVKLHYDKFLGKTTEPSPFIKKESPKNHYKFVDKHLGSGLIGQSRTAIHKQTNAKYTTKIFTRNKMDSNERKVLKREIAILLKLSHPNILTLHEAYESTTSTYLIFEPVTGGELFDTILKNTKPFYEKDAADIIHQVVDALIYMNEQGIAHRDLRPENLLYDDKDGKVKITDFGLSKDYSFEAMETKCGNTWYVAPEILLAETKTYGAACDVWSLGVVAFILLSGQIPFDGPSDDVVFDKILNAKYSFEPGHIWGPISPPGKDFIAKTFVTEPKKRITPTQCLAHPWLREKKHSQNPLVLMKKSLGDNSPRLSYPSPKMPTVEASDSSSN